MKFYYGVMGAGKTTELIKTFDIYNRKKLNPIIIKPAIDDREGKFCGWGYTQSRIAKEKKPAYYFNDISEIKELSYGVLLVDEAQFLTKKDIMSLAKLSYQSKKEIIFYGLKTDVNGNLFEGAATLLAICDETKELEALCEIEGCTNKAQVHLRYIDGKVDKSNNTVVIEKDNVVYKAVCLNCWIKERE